MKTLMLLRHGKSPRPNGVSDHQRPLKKKAAKQIADVGKQLRRKNQAPSRVLSSDALRASQTAEAFCEAARCGQPVLMAELYDAAPADLLQAIRKYANEAEALMVVGHNPTMEDCCDMLHPGCLPDGHLRTGAIAIFELNIKDWNEITNGTGKLQQLIESH